MLTQQAKNDRADYIEPREMPEIIRRGVSAGGSTARGLGNHADVLGIVDDGRGYDDDTGPSPRGGGMCSIRTKPSVTCSNSPIAYCRTCADDCDRPAGDGDVLQCGKRTNRCHYNPGTSNPHHTL